MKFLPTLLIVLNNVINFAAGAYSKLRNFSSGPGNDLLYYTVVDPISSYVFWTEQLK